MPPRLVRDVADAARWAAHSRALESERPDALFRDPLARRLAGEHGRSIAERLARLSLNWVVPVPLSLPPAGPQVPRANLNCSESRVHAPGIRGLPVRTPTSDVNLASP